MSVTIGDMTFDRVRYDESGDVLYLHRGDPADAVEFDASPEGHHLRFDADGRLIGVTIVNAKLLLDREKTIAVTVEAPGVQDPAHRGQRRLDAAGLPSRDL